MIHIPKIPSHAQLQGRFSCVELLHGNSALSLYVITCFYICMVAFLLHAYIMCKLILDNVHVEI